MLVSRRRLAVVIEKIRGIREHIRSYILAPDKVPVSVEDLQWVVQDMYGLRVTKHEVATTAIFLRGLVMRYKDGHAEILVRSDQSVAWKRFAAAKELCHLAIDQEDDWSIDVVNTIEGLIETQKLELNDQGTEHSPNEFVVSEHLAAYAAVEILYPPELRIKDAADLAAGSVTYSSLALRYQIPAPMVQWAHTPNYQAIVKEYDEQIRGENNA